LLALLTHLLTYLLTSCVTSCDPGEWGLGSNAAGYDSNVYLEYLIIRYFTYLVSYSLYLLAYLLYLLSYLLTYFTYLRTYFTYLFTYFTFKSPTDRQTDKPKKLNIFGRPGGG